MKLLKVQHKNHNIKNHVYKQYRTLNSVSYLSTDDAVGFSSTPVVVLLFIGRNMNVSLRFVSI